MQSKRYRDILPDRQAVQQEIFLKDEPQMIPPEIGSSGIIQRFQIDLSDPDLSAGWLIDGGQYI